MMTRMDERSFFLKKSNNEYIYIYIDVGRMQTLSRSREDTLEHAEAFLRGLDVEEIPYLSPGFLRQVGLVEKKRRDGPPRRRSSSSFNSSYSPRGDRRSSERSFTKRFDNSESEGRDSYRRRDNSSDRFSDRRRDNNSDRFNDRRRDNNNGDRFNDRRRDSYNDRGSNRGYKRGGDEQPERKSYKFDRFD